MSQPIILVTGATSTVGVEIVRQLTDAGHRVRVLVRNLTKAAKLGPKVEIFHGNLSDPESLASAFRGVESAFIASNGTNLHELETNGYVAAKQANVRHIVKLSWRGIDWPEFTNTTLAEWHGESELRLQELGPSWTVLRPGFLASNILQFKVMTQGGIFLPVGFGKDAPIDPFDIAAVAVAALTEAGHEERTYELTGPELLNFREIVDKLMAFTGTKLTFVDVPSARAFENLLKAGVPPRQAQALLIYFSMVKERRISVLPTVREVLGRPARTFEDWMFANAIALLSPTCH